MRLRPLLFLILPILFSFASAREAETGNVFLFTIDSCRADRLGTYGYAGHTTPNLDAWARTGTVFLRAYSTSAWTAPGLASILSGLYPPAHGINNRDATGPDSLVTLPKLLAEKGYLVPNLNFFTVAPYYTHLGLPKVNRSFFGPNEGDELLNWLRRVPGTGKKEPFFLWYHSTLVHQPFHPGIDQLPLPQSELEKSEGIRAVMNGVIVPVGSTTFSEKDRTTLNLLYDAEIRRADRLFGEAVRILRQQGLLDSTLIVVTADHGEELLDHGFVGHASTSLQAKLYEELIRIPMIFSWPGKVPGGRRIESRVSQIDVFPTLLNLLGMEVPGQVHGTDLFREPVADRPLFFESVISGSQTTKDHEDIWVRAVIQDPYKYITSEELYDLSSDPGERRNLIENDGSRAESMRKDLSNWLHRMTSQYHQMASGNLVPDDPTEARKCPTVTTPQNGTTLRYDQHTGVILIDWVGARDARYLIEYNIGRDDHHIAGVFEVEGNHQILGPLGKELWSNVRAWNPFKIRVSPRVSPPCWSDWVMFEF